VADLYGGLGAPVQIVGVRTAEMIKYASNAFLAAKISFINEMAAICESLGADVEEVAAGMGSDRRIGPAFLQAGLGWGGSCFPKDVRALAHMAAVHGTHPQLLRAVMEINSDQRLRAVQKLSDALGGLEGRRVIVLGAAFKPHTDDIRNSPALELAQLLVAEGCDVAVHDPVVTAARIAGVASDVTVAGSPEEGFAGRDAVVVATAWPGYADLDFPALGESMRTRVLLDARNTVDPGACIAAGFRYLALGRALPPQEAPDAVALDRLG
jgi:UDPglucose 6-dehydrogenase